MLDGPGDFFIPFGCGDHSLIVPDAETRLLETQDQFRSLLGVLMGIA